MRKWFDQLYMKHVWVGGFSQQQNCETEETGYYNPLLLQIFYSINMPHDAIILLPIFFYYTTCINTQKDDCLI